MTVNSLLGFAWAFVVERVKGIEPSLSAWELPIISGCRPLTCGFGGLEWPRLTPDRPG
jgi:hypothetical protein